MALSPHLGVQVEGVTGVEGLLDEVLISRCLEALKWRGVLLFRGVNLDDEAQLAFSRRLAMTGGGTEFASTYAAYENLPEPERKRYEDVRVVHSFVAAQRAVKPGRAEEELAAWRRVPTNEMSLVWKRRDGRRSLVIGATADHVVGMEEAESRALLDELLAQATQDRFRYTHDWQVGDLVVWDNTGMLHRAPPYDAASERTLHRTTIVGDEAFP